MPAHATSVMKMPAAVTNRDTGALLRGPGLTAWGRQRCRNAEGRQVQQLCHTRGRCVMVGRPRRLSSWHGRLASRRQLRLKRRSFYDRLAEDSFSYDLIRLPQQRSLTERQRCSILIGIHSREIVSGIYVFRPAEKELLERLRRPGPQRITDSAKRDLPEKRLRARDGDDGEVSREDARPVRDQVIPREGDIRVTAGDHLGEIAMHDPEATRKSRHLCREESVGGGRPEQRVGGGSALGTNIPRIGQRDSRTRAAHIGETLNTERVAFAH